MSCFYQRTVGISFSLAFVPVCYHFCNHLSPFLSLWPCCEDSFWLQCVLLLNSHRRPSGRLPSAQFCCLEALIAEIKTVPFHLTSLLVLGTCCCLFFSFALPIFFSFLWCTQEAIVQTLMLSFPFLELSAVLIGCHEEREAKIKKMIYLFENKTMLNLILVFLLSML